MNKNKNTDYTLMPRKKGVNYLISFNRTYFIRESSGAGPEKFTP
jgi:hypothetical protein